MSTQIVSEKYTKISATIGISFPGIFRECVSERFDTIPKLSTYSSTFRTTYAAMVIHHERDNDVK